MNAVFENEPAIPLDAGAMPNWKTIAIDETNEPLVPLGPFSAYESLLTSSVYFGEHSHSPYNDDGKKLDGTLLTIFVREGVVKRLVRAQALLPTGYHFLIFDAYRPLEVQDSLYHFYYDALRDLRPHLTDAELEEETQKYVALPSYSADQPSPHNTGGAVDLVIVQLPEDQEKQLQQLDERLVDAAVDAPERVGLEVEKYALIRKHAQFLNFGTAFDHGSEMAGLAYFEEKLARGEPLSADEAEACRNRRFLYRIMADVGLEPRCTEWWHFNAPEAQMGAETAGLSTAHYGAIGLGAPLLDHERRRLAIYHETVTHHAARMAGMEAVSTMLDEQAQAALEIAGDPRKIHNHWPTEVISPV